ncbi:MAG TPA: hypothetical protein PLV92_23425, partial [Pirellulaceae bacterium]|nr:hypothetical protein [Pirellulaceae bacterium]
MLKRLEDLRRVRTFALFVASNFLIGAPLLAQEQVDKLDRQKQAAAAIGRMTVRVRVVKCVPQTERLVVEWRRGGEGLGGTVTRGRFATADSAEVQVGQWSDWLPAETVCGRAKGWEFPSVTLAYPPAGKKQPDPPSEVAVEFEWAERGVKFKSWIETAPRGATVGFAFPAATLDERGAQNPDFVRQLNGLAVHARQRRELLERQVGASSSAGAVPRKFGVLGHLAGFGQGPGSGLGKAVGFGVRHCNPEIVADECRTLQLLGINGLVDEKSVRMVELSGQGEKFRRIYWGGPGSGSPMAAVSSRGASEPDGCPFDPRLKETMAEQVERAIAQHRASGASEMWGLWWDEIGVASKAHLNDCPRCRDAFRDYLRAANVA